MIFQNCYTKFHEPLGEWNLRQFWNITSGIYAKYHVQIKRVAIFTCKYFKLSWNTTALSQSNCRNFACSSISRLIVSKQMWIKSLNKIWVLFTALFNPVFMIGSYILLLTLELKGLTHYESGFHQRHLHPHFLATDYYHL